MPLPIVCPICGASFPAEAGLQDAEARKALSAALDLPAPLASQVIPYLGLHAGHKRRLKWDKLTRIIAELNTLVQSGEVTRNRETRAAPLHAWSEGLAAVLEMRDGGKLDLPLEGHGLLCEIVHRAAGKSHAAQAASTRPLHPSHRPAVIPVADSPGAPPGQPPPDWGRSKASGIRHVSALMGALKQPPQEPDSTPSNPSQED